MSEVVAHGYDEIADRFAAWAAEIPDSRPDWARLGVAEGARVLELGCGAGLGETAWLAERYRVTGVDVSPEQLRRARRNVPADDSPDRVGEWLGTTMFFSGFDAATNRALLEEAGFALLRDEVVAEHEPEGDVAFQWVLARA